MASTINADTSAGLKLTSDTSGIIEFQSGGTTKAGVNATGLTGDASQLTAIPAGASLSTASGSAPSYSARAWVNFDGTAAAADMIRASGNVNSITDNGTGNYTLNFATAMPDVNYATVGTTVGITGSNVARLCLFSSFTSQTTSSVRVTTINTSNSAANRDTIAVVIFK